MESTPLISVIVPIYSIDRYLGVCVESILNQTYQKLEILLVDDGSPDRSPELCELYAEKDRRICVIHKQNGGLVSARKAGLAAASGRYATYVDGDDWIGPRYLEEMIRAAVGYQADLVISGHRRDLFDVSSKVRSNIPAGFFAMKRLEPLRRNMISSGKFFHIGISTYVWNKLFLREKLLAHQNAVDEAISIGEDAAVTYPYLLDAERVCIVDNFDYHYRQREDSMLKQNVSYRREQAGLRLLYRHLNAMSLKHENAYDLDRQTDDFLLAMCIMRSGGVLRAPGQNFSPYPQDFSGKDIVIWSAGTFGQQLMNRIRENDHCRVTGWIDPDYREYRRCCLNVDPIEDIDHMRYDYVVLATVNSDMAAAVQDKLIWRGIPAEKILSVQCPREMRKPMLDYYLNAAF